MFIGREKELAKLYNFLTNRNDKSLLLYGKRRVGKTELLREVFDRNSIDYVYFECTKNTLQTNIDDFKKVLENKGLIEPDITATSFTELFYVLKMTKCTLPIVIDEYSYLSEFTDSAIIDSQFQKIIDNYLSGYKLIITGSNVAIMTSLLTENNALFGRFNKTMFLDELTYNEAQLFYPNKSIYEKIGFYSVFGGSPFVNKEIDPNLSLEDNIKKTFLDDTNNVYNYCNYILFTDVASSMNINGICNILKNGKKSCAELENSLSVEKNGGMNKKLSTLINMGLINKTQPINKTGNNKASKYEINDNAIRFFYTFISQNKSFLLTFGENAFYNQFIANKLTTFISHRFEEMVRKYYISLVREGTITDILNVGFYSYDDSINKTSGEFDVALQLANNTYKIIEVKYYQNNPLTIKEMKQEEEQIKAIKELKISSFAFICTSGYEENNAYECIDITNLYS